MGGSLLGHVIDVVTCIERSVSESEQIPLFRTRGVLSNCSKSSTRTLGEMATKFPTLNLSLCLFCGAASVLILEAGCNSDGDAQGEERNDADGKNSSDVGDNGSKNSASDGGDDSESGAGSTESHGDDSNGGDESTNEDSSDASTPASFDYSAGSRLKPLVVSGSDGSKQLYGWYDNKLEVPCTYGMLNPGAAPPKEGAKIQCLPSMLHVETDKYYGTNGCDQETVSVGGPVGCDDATTYKYARVPPTLACGRDFEIKKVKSVTPFKYENSIWYKNRQGLCRMVDTTVANYVYVELGESVSMDIFVSGTTED